MTRIPLSIPEIGLIAGTRGALGAGIGLLLAGFLNKDQRKAVGLTLFAVGAISSIPIAIELYRSVKDAQSAQACGHEMGRLGREQQHA